MKITMNDATAERAIQKARSFCRMKLLQSPAVSYDSNHTILEEIKNTRLNLRNDTGDFRKR
jgi:hypothetical protein